MESARIVLLGEGGVGKTALTIKLCMDHFVEAYDPTIEDSYRKQVVIDGSPVTLEILDTAGQEEYLTLTDQWIINGDAFLIIFSLVEGHSLQTVDKYFEHIVRVRSDGAPLEREGDGSDAGGLGTRGRRLPPVLIAGNKLDLAEKGERKTSEREGQQRASELGCEYLETSAKTGANVENAFFALVRMFRQQQQSLLKRNKSFGSHVHKRSRRLCTII